MAVLIFTLVVLKVAKGCMAVLKVAKGLEADERDLVRPEVRRQRQQLRRAWPRARGGRVVSIVTFQYSSTTLYQVSYHIRQLFF
jgi:hypothetical protein